MFVLITVKLGVSLINCHGSNECCTVAVCANSFSPPLCLRGDQDTTASMLLLLNATAGANDKEASQAVTSTRELCQKRRKREMNVGCVRKKGEDERIL